MSKIKFSSNGGLLDAGGHQSYYTDLEEKLKSQLSETFKKEQKPQTSAAFMEDLKPQSSVTFKEELKPQTSTTLEENLTPQTSVTLTVPEPVSTTPSSAPRTLGAKKIEDLAAKIIQSNIIRVAKPNLWLYSTSEGHFVHEKEPFDFVYTAMDQEERNRFSDTDIGSVVKRIFAKREIRISYDDFDANDHLIGVKNGVVDLNSGHLLPHSPKFLLSTCVAANYVEGVETPSHPVFDQFCSTSLEDDSEKKALLLKIIGYLASSSTRAKRAFFFHGVSNSGKSLMLNFISRLLGEQNVSTVPLHKLGGKFYLAQLYGKKANIVGEIQGRKLPPMDTFKAITGSDLLQAEFKMKDAFSFRSKARLLFAGNTLPKPTEDDPSDAFANRLVVLLFNKPVDESKQDPNLGEKLWREADAILTDAIRAYAKWLDNDQNWSMPTESIQFINRYRHSKSILELFFEDCCDIHEDAKVYNVPLFSAYKQWCSENGFGALNLHKFHAELDKMGFKRDRWREGKENTQGRKGIDLKSRNTGTMGENP